MKSSRAPSCNPYLVSSPLWSRAPSRDENGKPYIDFMMIIPGLKSADRTAVEGYMASLSNCLSPFGNKVAYVDLNVRLNLLWVSAQPVPGLTRLLVEAIRRVIPHAKVVTADFNPDSDSRSVIKRWQGRLVTGIGRGLRLMGKR